MLLLTLMLTFLVASMTSGQETATVETPSGFVRGLKTIAPYTKDTVYQFRKIPFAKPPVQELRFKKPVSYGHWDGVLDATVYGPSCMQHMMQEFMEYELPNYDLSEDCLFLNIFVPHTLERDTKIPVMISVHGGGFIMGQGMFDDCSDLASFGNVIVVTFNYRLGIFGFLSMDDPAAQGNYGLWDQKLAFEWINKNIDAFGGDSNSVTIFGESAGGMSVHMHSLFPSNKGLFQKVIAQSGTIYSGYAMSKSNRYFSEITGKNVGCDMQKETNVEEFVNCLRQKTTEEIMQASDLTNFVDPSELVLQYGFGPCVDGEFIKDIPDKLVSDSYPDIVNFFQSLDFIVGTTSHEGSLLFYYLATSELLEKYQLDTTDGIPTSFVCDVLAKSAISEKYGNFSDAMSATCDFYSDSSSIANQGKRAVDLLGDLFFVAPASLAADLHSKGNPRSNTYRYTFSRSSPVPYISIGPSWYAGCGHGDELVAVFGPKYAMTKGQDIPEDYKQLSLKTQTYWTNFAKTGDPNKPSSGSVEVPQWPEYDSENQQYLNIDENIKSQKRPFADSVNFWLNVIPELVKNEEMKKQHEEL